MLLLKWLHVLVYLLQHGNTSLLENQMVNYMHVMLQVLLDYSSVIVHVFVPNTRTYYDLEHLWADGEPMDISEYLTPENSL